MLKVFLVEDESIVREGLRDNIPWDQYDYEFVGEASDGEIALPLIRKTKPDVLITDIKMPFMDGLALSNIVMQELPDIKIIIISGYDDFEYARQAIRIGVEQYLLKPVTRSALQKALQEVREKVEAEWEQKDYLKKFQNEMREYEQFARRRFFEKVFAGRLSVQEIYEEAQKVSLNLHASSYNLVMISLNDKRGEESGMDSQLFDRYQEELLHYFPGFPEYFIFQWNVSVYGILIMGEPDRIEELTQRCIENVRRICELPPGGLEWHVVAGNPVERLSLLPEVYSKVNHLLSYRFLLPDKPILTEQDLELLPGNEESDMSGLGNAQVDPELLQRFLKEGQSEEVHDFVSGYVQSMKEQLKSKMFRNYLVLSTRFAVIAFVEKMGYEQEKFFQTIAADKLQEYVLNPEDISEYMEVLLSRAIELRDQENEYKGKKVISDALEYIEAHYTEEDFSLNKVAEQVHVSPNYLSAIFSSEMETTFVEYVTRKRLEKAKQLLRQTDWTAQEIAGEAGYKEAHYFSFVFKKTVGCTPKEYRNQNKR